MSEKREYYREQFLQAMRQAVRDMAMRVVEESARMTDGQLSRARKNLEEVCYRLDLDMQKQETVAQRSADRDQAIIAGTDA